MPTNGALGCETQGRRNAMNEPLQSETCTNDGGIPGDQPFASKEHSAIEQEETHRGAEEVDRQRKEAP